MIYKYISIKSVFAKVYRDLGITYEISELDMLEWSTEALSMIGSFSQYEEITTNLEFVNGKAKLPCGFDRLVNIDYCGQPMYWSTSTNRHNYECNGCGVPNYTSGCCNDGFSFYINDSYLISDINCEEGKKVSITYLGIPTDDEGYPLVPDDVYFMKALVAYITFMIDKQEHRKGKLPDKILQESKTDWLFYVNSARGSANMPNLAQLENFRNILRRMIPVSGDYSTGFKNFNKKENFKGNGRY